MFRPLLALALLASPALAADLPALPTFAQNPEASAPDYWKGFYVGAGVSATGGRGMKGAFGADTFAGYERVFANGVTLGARVDIGANPWISPGGLARGYDFAEADVKLGVQMGQLTPYVFTGVALGTVTGFAPAGLNGAAAVNSLFADPGASRAGGRVGVGVDYHVNDRLTIGVSASVSQNTYGVAP